jgi:DNA mismatch repair protein MSH5
MVGNLTLLIKHYLLHSPLDLDHHIGDLYPHIVGKSNFPPNRLMIAYFSDREIEIIQTLLEKAVVYEDTLARTSELCAELDCLLSFAEASRTHNYVRPEMTHENIIDISRGR